MRLHFQTPLVIGILTSADKVISKITADAGGHIVYDTVGPNLGESRKESEEWESNGGEGSWVWIRHV